MDNIMLVKEHYSNDEDFVIGDVSKATERNWSRLNTNSEHRLTKRANKSRSDKNFIPSERCTNPKSEEYINEIITFKHHNKITLESLLFSLCLKLFAQNSISNSNSVKKFVNDYSHLIAVDSVMSIEIPEEFDMLGTVYQSLLSEGKKNIKGSYYTPKHIACSILSDFSFSKDNTFLDPCCGSGAFLLCVEGVNPKNLYGYDIDKISVMLAKANLIIKFKKYDFYPNIECLDFLSKKNVCNKQFDFIATNPPWGASDSTTVLPIISGETSSKFFVRSYSLLKKGGVLSFLLPISLLNVKVHKDVRQFILENGRLEKIRIFPDMFTGVTTTSVSIKHSKNDYKDTIEYTSPLKTCFINRSSFYKTENYTFTQVENIDENIILKIKSKGNLTLRDSKWALGVVTGDNANKVHDTYKDGEELIYTGKEIKPYKLLKAKKYILFDRKQLQQVAKDEFYRCPEKLVYKFISKKLVFAYDNTGALFLNSANILIPKIPGMCIKTVMAFLNTPIFQYLYIKMFNEIKILKGNLLLLPFPKVSKEQDIELSKLVDSVLKEENVAISKIEEWMKNFYSLNDEEISHINEVINGKVA